MPSSSLNPNNNMANKTTKLILVYHQLQFQSNTPHFGLLSLAAYIRQKMPHVQIKIIDHPNPMKEILKFKPDIVGLTGASVEYQGAIDLAKKIRKKINPLIIIGGIHISTAPNSFNKIFDIGILGEGEITLSQVIEAYQNKQINHANLQNIDGLIYFYHRHLHFTKPRQLIPNIDELPFPARDMIPMENYLQNHKNFYNIKRMMIITTSRGCPYHCIYCSSSAHWGRFRFHSVDYVIKEMEHLINTYHVDGITFWDDLFIAPKERIIELAKEIKKRGWHKTITFIGQARSNLADEKVIKALKSINFKRLSFGFETYSPKMLDYLKVHSVQVEDNLKTIKLCKKYGIDVTAGFIVGSPTETIEDLKITYNTMKKYPLDVTNIYLLAAYPGTKMWQFCQEHDLVSDHMDLDRISTEIPLKACFQFWKKDPFDFLNDHLFLNLEKRHDKKYLKMILKIKRLSTIQNIKYYIKYSLKNPKAVLNLLIG